MMIHRLEELQWIAAAFSVFGAWGAGSRESGQRLSGFTLFLLSNVVWLVWAGGTGAWGLFAMQIVFTATSIRGIVINRRDTP